ncbi:MAG: T9SS type A sorting domain-containing protein [Bacteroidia bacterium]|nr:T9SS type A sorting domain-containing protein [Bacteroidia bacterium]
MKKSLLLLFLVVTSARLFSQPVVYFNFLSHNEETNQWNGNTFYNANRLKLITLSNYFQTNGITWNMQSDWTYLTNAITKEPALVGTSTNNKTILRWMYEDKGVEMDPHGHETQYIYPDLVKLMDSIGLPESKVMGGTLYNQPNGINLWTNLINGQYGAMFPTKFWAPDYMMGGGTPMHVADLKYYGIWNPMDTANYLTHYPANHLRHIGVGCSIKIKSGDTASVIINEIKAVVQKVQSGQYPSNGFYLQTIFFEQADLNNLAFYNMVIEIADSTNALVAGGNAQWKTLKQAYTEWETTFAAQMFQWECDDVTAGVAEHTQENMSTVFPNPSNGSVTLQISNEIFTKQATGKTIYELKIYDGTGREVRKQEIKNQKTELLTGDLPSGIYFYQVKNSNQIISSGKMVIE